jgi:hypothetical protein
MIRPHAQHESMLGLHAKAQCTMGRWGRWEREEPQKLEGEGEGGCGWDGRGRVVRRGCCWQHEEWDVVLMH